jgi:hypothetical protein
MSRITKNYYFVPILLVVALCFSGCNFDNIPFVKKKAVILSGKELEKLSDDILGKSLVGLKSLKAGFSMGDRQYVMVVFLRQAAPAKLYEINRGLAMEYHVKGYLPTSYGEYLDKLLLQDLNRDGIPEFVYQTHSGGTGSEQYEWYIVNVAAREAVSAQFSIDYGPYGGESIKLDETAEGKPYYKDMFLSQINQVKKVREEESKKIQPVEGNKIELLDKHWLKHNGLRCSKLTSPCKVSLLWLPFPGEAELFGEWTRGAEDENASYKVISMFKGGIYLIDKSRKKIVLIFLPESQYDWSKKVKIDGNTIKFWSDDYIITYQIDSQMLKKN